MDRLRIGADLEVFAFCCPAAHANIQGYQLALAAVELFVFGNFPFVKTAFAQGFSLVNLAGFGAFKGQNVSHNVCTSDFLYFGR